MNQRQKRLLNPQTNKVLNDEQKNRKNIHISKIATMNIIDTLTPSKYSTSKSKPKRRISGNKLFGEAHIARVGETYISDVKYSDIKTLTKASKRSVSRNQKEIEHLQKPMDQKLGIESVLTIVVNDKEEVGEITNIIQKFGDISGIHRASTMEDDLEFMEYMEQLKKKKSLKKLEDLLDQTAE